MLTITITVTNTYGHSMTFERVDKYMSVQELKKAVCAGQGGLIHPHIQRLVYKGKQLDDTRILESYQMEQPILLHLVLRLVGGNGPFPFIDTSFPHEAILRDICVYGRHWWDIPAPDAKWVCKKWYPEGIHSPPASDDIYQQLLNECRDTPRSIEEVGHEILERNGYTIQEDGWYHLDESLRKTGTVSRDSVQFYELWFGTNVSEDICEKAV